MTLGQDTLLNRTVAAGSTSWGTASDGQTWVTGGDTRITYGVTSGVGGTITAALGNNYSSSYLGNNQAADLGLSCSFKTSNLTNLFGFVLRAADKGSDNEYEIQWYNGTLTIQKCVANVRTTLASITSTLSLNTWYNYRVAALGTSLNAKIWDAGAAEPAAWDISITDSTYTAAGSYGVFSSLSSGTTITVKNFNTDTSTIVLYGSSVADPVLTSANDMAVGTPGGVETSTTTVTSGTNLYAEIESQGNASSIGVVSIPAMPTGNGWVYDPEAGTFDAAPWSASITTSGPQALGASASLTLRIFHSSGGVYTLIGQITTLITNVKTAWAFAATLMPVIACATSDFMYFDLWLYDDATINGDNLSVYLSTTASSGVVGDMQITAPNFSSTSDPVTNVLPRPFGNTLVRTFVPRPFGSTLVRYVGLPTTPGAFGNDTITNRMIVAGSTDWGTATDGQTWVAGGDNRITYGVIAGTGGTITAAVGNNFSALYLGSTTVKDLVLFCKFFMSSSASSEFGYSLRAVDKTTNNEYQLQWSGAVLTIQKCVAGAITPLATASIALTGNTIYNYRAIANGPFLGAKIWVDGTGEPAAWTVSTNDSTYTAAGYYGVYSSISAGITTTVKSFTADVPPPSTRTITSSAALLQTNTRTITSSAALLATNTRTIATSSALIATSSRTIPDTAALLQTSSRTLPDTAVLLATSIRTISTTAALLATSTRTVPTSANVSASRTIPTSAALLATSTRTIGTTAALLALVTRTIPDTAALLATLQRTIPTSAVLLATSSRTISSTAVLLATSTRTIPDTAVLLATSSRTISTTAVLTTPGATSRTIPTSAVLLSTQTRTIGTTAALLTTSSRTIPSSASLLWTKLRTITSSAAVLATQTRTITTSSVLLATSTRTITGTAALLAARTIPGTAVLRQTSTRTITTSAVVLATQTRTIPTSSTLLVQGTGVRTIPTSAALMVTITPNATALVRSGQAAFTVHSGQATATIRSGQATIFIRSGTATLVIRSGLTVIQVD